MFRRETHRRKPLGLGVDKKFLDLTLKSWLMNFGKRMKKWVWEKYLQVILIFFKGGIIFVSFSHTTSKKYLIINSTQWVWKCLLKWNLKVD